MSMLFYIDERQMVCLHPEVVKLCESFRTLNDKEICYIVLAFDYNSKYRQFPEHERKRKAMWEAFGDNETDLIESHRILTAVNDYISLQYNPKIEVARSYQKKIDKFLMQLEHDESPSNVKKITDAISSLRENIAALEKEVDMSVQREGVIKGKMQLSYLEKCMSNMKNYNAIIAPKK